MFFLLLNAEVSEGIIREGRNGSHNLYMQVRTPEHKHRDKRKGKLDKRDSRYQRILAVK